MLQKQVDKSHYHFADYVSKGRWASIWHQLDEVVATGCESALEIGPGPGVFKNIASQFNITIKSVDLDPDLNPDVVASVTDLPFEDNSFPCVCAFQMLEHLPYDESLKGFAEIVRVAKDHVIISLPDAKIKWVYSFHIPKIGVKVFHIPRPQFRRKQHVFNGEHHWEINKKGYPLKKIINDFLSVNKSIDLFKTYRVNENPYHRFFVFKKSTR